MYEMESGAGALPFVLLGLGVDDGAETDKAAAGHQAARRV